MDVIDKIMLAFAAATWGLYFVTRKNAAFGLAAIITVFALIYIAADF
jgi:hypothetical protein